jgi:hypothetical protein
MLSALYLSDDNSLRMCSEEINQSWPRGTTLQTNGKPWSHGSLPWSKPKVQGWTDTQHFHMLNHLLCYVHGELLILGLGGFQHNFYWEDQSLILLLHQPAWDDNFSFCKDKVNHKVPLKVHYDNQSYFLGLCQLTHVCCLAGSFLPSGMLNSSNNNLLP